MTGWQDDRKEYDRTKDRQRILGKYMIEDIRQDLTSFKSPLCRTNWCRRIRIRIPPSKKNRIRLGSGFTILVVKRTPTKAVAVYLYLVIVLTPLKEGFMQVPMLTAREELDIGEKTVAAEIDAYFRWESYIRIFFGFNYQNVGVSSLVYFCFQYR